MLDVEFLLKAPPIDRHVVYKYRTGLLKRDVRLVLEKDAHEQELQFISVDPQSVSRELGSNIFTGLVRTFTFCEIQKHTIVDVDDDVARTLIKGLSEQNEDRIALFLPTTSKLTTHARWAEIEVRVLLIEEPEITPKTLPPVLRYLEQTSGLGRRPGFATKPLFMQSLASEIDDGIDFGELRIAFLKRTITMTDAATGAFDVDGYKREVAPTRGRTSPSARVRALIANPDSQSLIGFIVCVDERLQSGWTAGRIVRELHRIARQSVPLVATAAQLGEAEAAGLRSRDPEQDARALLWCVVFLAWEATVLDAARSIATYERRSPSVFVPALDQMGRDFLRRVRCNDEERALDGLWPALRTALAYLNGHERGNLQTAQIRTVRHLGSGLDAATSVNGLPWRTRLQAILRPAVERVDAELLQREQSHLSQSDVDRRVWSKLNAASLKGKTHA